MLFVLIYQICNKLLEVHQDSEVHVRYNEYSPYHFHKIAPYLGKPDFSVARVNKTETT